MKALFELGSDDVEQYGNKAATLGEICQIRGINVPRVFALSPTDTEYMLMLPIH